MTAFTVSYDIDARVDLHASACILEINLDKPVTSIKNLERFSTSYVIFRYKGKILGASVLPIHAGVCLASDIQEAVKAFKYQKLRAELEKAVEVELDDRSNTSNKRNSVSVIIPTCDRPDLLKKCLNGLQLQTYQAEKIIVVDNRPGNTDLKAMLSEYYPEVEYLDCDTPGVSAARNKGASVAKSKYLAFLDDDTIPSKDWLDKLYKRIEADKRIAAVTGLVLPAEIETDAQARMEALGGFNGGFVARWILPATSKKDEVFRHLDFPKIGVGSQLLVKREIFEAIAGFDQSIGAGLGIDCEDYDFYSRLVDSGHVLMYEPSAAVFHHHLKTEEELGCQLIRAAWSTGFLWGRLAMIQPRLRKSTRKYFVKYLKVLAHQALHATLVPDVLVSRQGRSKLIRYISGYLKGRFTKEPVVLSLWTNTTERNTEASNTPPVKVQQIDLICPLPQYIDCTGYSSVEAQIFCGEKYITSIRAPATDSVVSIYQILNNIPDPVLEGVVGHLKSFRLEYPVCEEMPEENNTPSDRIKLAGEMAWKPSVSVVIPTRDRPDYLSECLLRISTQDYDGDLEIIVIDNNPISGLTHPIVSQYPGIIYQECNKPGVSAARNTAFSRAKGEIFVLTDDDVLVPKSWISNIVGRFARQDVMMVNGSVLPYSLSNSAETGFEDMCGFPSTYSTKEATGSTFRDEPSFHLASLGVGANMSFRSLILESPDIGDMCEIFGAGVPTGGGEDAEFIYRILKEGLTVIFDPSIWVHHRHRRSASDLHRQLFGYGKSNSALYLHLLFTHKDFRSLYWLLFNIPYSLLMLMYRSDYRRLWLTVFRGYFCGFPAYFWSIIKDREYSRKIDSVQRAVPSPKQLK